MSVINEHVEELVEEARRLSMTITDGVKHGFLVDEGGTLQEQVHKLMAAARMVEAEIHAFDPVDPEDGGWPDGALETQYGPDHETGADL